MRRLLFGVHLLLVAACGGDGTAAITTDAPATSDAGADAPQSFAACAEFSAAAGVAVPTHFTGTLGNADVESPTSCPGDAPFGIESAGPDRVVPLTNLSPGAPYVVKLTSTSDLAFYVATGCDTETGPGADQCQLFEDAAGEGVPEVGRFVAGGAKAYVIVDYYASHAPPSSDFTLDVYAEQCQDNSQCSAATPACFEGRCVGCTTSFDCSTAAAPMCNTATQGCVTGADICTTDGLDEPANDGPAGATTIVLDGTGHSVINGKICSAPQSEYDYFGFDVTTLGETWDFQLNWVGSRDLDLHVYDATGDEMALSFWEQPERARLTYLPLGRYYVRVREYVSTPDASPVTYSLTTQRTLGPGCTGAADCAVEYRNQMFRGQCTAGACVPIDGNGALPEGGHCDSQSDCALALHCPSFFFVAGGDTRETCARSCTDDSACAPLGASFVCTTYFSNNFCVKKCTTDDQCPTVIASPPIAGPWRRLTCDVPTGRCVP